MSTCATARIIAGCSPNTCCRSAAGCTGRASCPPRSGSWTRRAPSEGCGRGRLAVLGKVVSALLLLVTLLALYNVYGDNTELVKNAETLACGRACVRLLEAQRTPLGQRFKFQTSVQPARTLDV